MTAAVWPDLPYPAWRDTAATLQLWTQIVGKVRLALTPWVNHGWQVPLYVTARGLGTSPIPIDNEILEIEFDFIDHRLAVRTSTGENRYLPLKPQTVADFHRGVVDLLNGIGVAVVLNEMPNEVPNPIRFSQDRSHAAYDADAAHRFWRALVQADRIFKLFRSGFLGKVSPVHFFWGSFDLAVTRFSGRKAPLHPGGVPGLPDDVAREAYSHEASSAGFWPGNDAFPNAAFYSYAYPEPAGFRSRKVRPAPASMRRWASSSCLTIRSATRRSPMPCCSIFLPPPMPPRPMPEIGTARRSNVRWACQRGCGRFRASSAEIGSHPLTLPSPPIWGVMHLTYRDAKPSLSPDVANVEITPEIIEAGCEAISRFFGWALDDPEKIVISVFSAMRAASLEATVDPGELRSEPASPASVTQARLVHLPATRFHE